MRMSDAAASLRASKVTEQNRPISPLFRSQQQTLRMNTHGRLPLDDGGNMALFSSEHRVSMRERERFLGFGKKGVTSSAMRFRSSMRITGE
jgi:hypothetical protein